MTPPELNVSIKDPGFLSVMASAAATWTRASQDKTCWVYHEQEDN